MYLGNGKARNGNPSSTEQQQNSEGKISFSIQGTKKEIRQKLFNNNCPKPAIQPRKKKQKKKQTKLSPMLRGWTRSLESHLKRDKEGSLPSLLGDIREGLMGSQGFHCHVVVTRPPQEVSVEATCRTQIGHTCRSQPRWYQWKLSVAGTFFLTQLWRGALHPSCISMDTGLPPPLSSNKAVPLLPRQNDVKVC